MLRPEAAGGKGSASGAKARRAAGEQFEPRTLDDFMESLGFEGAGKDPWWQVGQRVVISTKGGRAVS